ncbi:MAG TPA: ArsA family ATPase [Polyangiaceae bacterium]|nr:ArsA family ATPase [Polyangiaceae bacterium]
MLPFDRRRFLFVTGKGGVGKTTVSAALARGLAERGKRVLLCTSGAKEGLSPLLGVPRLGTSIELLAPNLWGVLLTSEVALREYGVLVLHSQTVVNALFDNKYVSGLFNGAPGLKEWALLGKAWYHAIETLPNGALRFDVVVFDAPATGHSLDMLRVPKVILAAAPPGRLRTDAERAIAFLRDPASSGVVLATLPEEMPTNETLELARAVREELELPIVEVVANSCLEELFTDAEGRALEPLVAQRGNDAESALAAAARRALAERTQRESLARLAVLGLPLRKLPKVPGGAGSPAALAALVPHLF